VSTTFFVLLQLSILAYALIAGVFLAFSDFIMRSLALTGGVEAMQVINREVFRWVFMALFLGMATVSVLIAGYAWVALSGPAGTLIGLAALVYLVGCFGVTVVFNVPMNQALAGMVPTSEAMGGAPQVSIDDGLIGLVLVGDLAAVDAIVQQLLERPAVDRTAALGPDAAGVQRPDNGGGGSGPREDREHGPDLRRLGLVHDPLAVDLAERRVSAKFLQGQPLASFHHADPRNAVCMGRAFRIRNVKASGMTIVNSPAPNSMAVSGVPLRSTSQPASVGLTAITA
jgi:uncharacterized membrane protein